MKYDWVCYAGKNVRMNLRNNDEGTEAYKDEYRLFLSILWDYIEYWGKWSENSGWGPYEDPDAYDSSKGMRINPKFYLDLCDFLKIRAKDQNDKKYEFNDNFIKCGDINLVSDQFGFSAPGLELSHPYDIYLKKCKKEKKDRDDAIKKVVNWVMESRTIGGSFLWPEGIWGGQNGYNTARGGRNPFDAEGKYKKGSGRSYSYYYIEDRVDLTLCEIKHYLNYEDSTLHRLNDCIKKNSAEEKWIRFFGGFKGYIEFFCFDPFVNKEKNYMPYDIVNSNMVENKRVCIDENKTNYKDRENNSIFKLSTDEFETMFNNVNYMIKERSRMMLETLNLKSSPSD